MATLHLIYSTMKRMFDDTHIPRIQLVKRRKIIKQWLNECNMLPTAVNDLIHAYDGEIITLNGHFHRMHSTWIGNDTDTYHHYLIDLEYNYCVIRIHIYKHHTNDKILCSIMCYGEIIQDFKGYHVYEHIYYINVFMKQIYGKDNYIDYPSRNPKHMADMFVIKKNSIVCINEQHNSITGIIVKDCRELTYIIVIIKCIMNGIQRYFREKKLIHESD